MNIESILDPELWDSIESNFKSGKYTNAIVDAMLFLSNVLREKSNLEEDGVKLVNSIFSKKDPKIKISKLETETDKSMQEGAANILRGMYQLIRNPRHHEKIEDSENDALQIIFFISYMLSILEKSRSKFELDDFESLIFDEEFVEEDEYTKLIVDRIPKRKIYEVLVSIYRKKIDGNINHIQRFFSSIFIKLSEIEKTDFLQIISNDLLKTNDDNERKYILKCFPPNLWSQVDEISKIRTENRIISSIEDGKAYDNKRSSDGWLATWCTQLFKEFSLKEKLFSVISAKLSSDDISQIKYCFKYTIDNIWDLLDAKELEKLDKMDDGPLFFDFNYWFLRTMKNEVEKGNKLFYDYIRKSKYQMPQVVASYFAEHLDNFKENKELETVSDDDYVETKEDDIPF